MKGKEVEKASDTSYNWSIGFTESHLKNRKYDSVHVSTQRYDDTMSRFNHLKKISIGFIVSTFFGLASVLDY